MYLVKIGTIQYRLGSTIQPDEVEYVGDIFPRMKWDNVLGNMRAMTQSEIAAEEKSKAATSIDNGATVAADQRERIERCIVSIVCAEFNRHTDVEKAMFDAVAAATSLADLKTRYAAITQVPQRSLSDLVAAIKVALAATPE